MSWDILSDETASCDCGAGSVRVIVEMNDWNRTRRARNILCQSCKTEHDDMLRKREINQKTREKLLRKAQKMARERYLDRWLAMFDGKSKKQVWQSISVDGGYPALGTFYRHIRDEGLKQYLTRWFDMQIVLALANMEVHDEEISALLRARDAIPEHREPHPWQ